MHMHMDDPPWTARQAIGECGRPMVVHNGMYDLMFFMDALHGPLPERLEEFKAQVRACFPNTAIYDTKYCESHGPPCGVLCCAVLCCMRLTD